MLEISAEALNVALANSAVLLAAIVQTSTGMGFAMIAAPLLAIISIEFVPGPMLVANLCLSTLMLREGRSDIVKSEVKVLLPAIVVGTVLAAALLSQVSADFFKLIFAVIILLAVAISLSIKTPELSLSTLSIGGMMAGLMGTTSGISGPPMAVLYQKEDIFKTRATLSLVFSFSYFASLIALAFADLFSMALAIKGFLMLPGLLIGFIVAKYVRAWLSQSLARVLMLSIASFSAFLLLYKTL